MDDKTVICAVIVSYFAWNYMLKLYESDWWRQGIIFFAHGSLAFCKEILARGFLLPHNTPSNK